MRKDSPSHDCSTGQSLRAFLAPIIFVSVRFIDNLLRQDFLGHTEKRYKIQVHWAYFNDI